MLVIRPMALRLSRVPSENHVKALVRSTTFLGEMRRYVLQVGDLQLVADQPFTELEALDSELWLKIYPAAGVHILPVTKS
jgi:hypothetical protein